MEKEALRILIEEKEDGLDLEQEGDLFEVTPALLAFAITTLHTLYEGDISSKKIKEVLNTMIEEIIESMKEDGAFREDSEEKTAAQEETPLKISIEKNNDNIISEMKGDNAEVIFNLIFFACWKAAKSHHSLETMNQIFFGELKKILNNMMDDAFSIIQKGEKI